MPVDSVTLGISLSFYFRCRFCAAGYGGLDLAAIEQRAIDHYRDNHGLTPPTLEKVEKLVEMGFFIHPSEQHNPQQ